MMGKDFTCEATSVKTESASLKKFLFKLISMIFVSLM